MADTAKYRVRMATEQDEPQLMLLCEGLAEENALFTPNFDKVRETVRNVLHNKQGFVGCIGSHDRLEGAIMIIVSAMWYTDQPCLEELFNYVAPEFRASSRAVQLVEFAKSVSNKMALPMLIGIVSNVRTEAKVRLYDRKLSRAGAFYLHQPAKDAA